MSVVKINAISVPPHAREELEKRFAQRAGTVDEVHGSFAGWIEANHPRSKAEWVTLYRQTFRFTGGEIVGEFLMSIGVLPGAHLPRCPVYPRILRQRPLWARVRKAASR